MKKLMIIAVLALSLAACNNSKPEVKFLKNLDSTVLKAEVKGANVGSWIAGLRLAADSLGNSKSDTMRVRAYNAIYNLSRKFDSVFTDSTVNPIFKK